MLIKLHNIFTTGCLIFLWGNTCFSHDVIQPYIDTGVVIDVKDSKPAVYSVESATDTYKLWPINTVLKVCFFNGELETWRYIEEVVSEWNEVSSTKFEFRINGEYRNCLKSSDHVVRVDLDSAQHGSIYGSDALKIPIDTATLHLNLIDTWKKNPAITEKIIIHRFGHALGFADLLPLNNLCRLAAHELRVATQKSIAQISTRASEQNLRKFFSDNGDFEFDDSVDSPMSIGTIEQWESEIDTARICDELNIDSTLSKFDKQYAMVAYPKVQSTRELFQRALSNTLIEDLVENAPVVAGKKVDFTESQLFALDQQIQQKLRKIDTERAAAQLSNGVADIHSSQNDHETQTEASYLIITPIVQTSTIEQKTRTTKRSGISTGSLFETRCGTFDYPATPGWEIDPQSVKFVNVVKKADSWMDILSRSTSSITVRHCVRSTFSNFTKLTGDSFASVRFTERREKIEKENATSEIVSVSEPFSGVVLQLPENTVSYIAEIATTDKNTGSLIRTGKIGDIETEFDLSSGLLTIDVAE